LFCPLNHQNWGKFFINLSGSQKIAAEMPKKLDFSRFFLTNTTPIVKLGQKGNLGEPFIKRIGLN